MNSIFGRSSRFFAVITLLVALTANIACAGQGQMMKKESGMMKKEGSMSKGSHNASAVSNSLVGVQGYDLVSYQTNGKPMRGNGNHTVEHHGATYQFMNEENKEAFTKDPHKYLPAYGGYCAYGVAVGKKFVGDPHVWKIVDNKLYLNLDNKIQGIWNKDISGNIQKAESKWGQIKNKKASDL